VTFYAEEVTSTSEDDERKQEVDASGSEGEGSQSFIN
jgi:hypothetical protein